MVQPAGRERGAARARAGPGGRRPPARGAGRRRARARARAGRSAPLGRAVVDPARGAHQLPRRPAAATPRRSRSCSRPRSTSSTTPTIAPRWGSRAGCWPRSRGFLRPRAPPPPRRRRASWRERVWTAASATSTRSPPSSARPGCRSCSAGLGTVELPVRLLSDAVILGGDPAGAVPIPVPKTDPIVIAVDDVEVRLRWARSIWSELRTREASAAHDRRRHVHDLPGRGRASHARGPRRRAGYRDRRAHGGHRRGRSAPPGPVRAGHGPARRHRRDRRPQGELLPSSTSTSPSRPRRW